jgi:hypothetical protein
MNMKTGVMQKSKSYPRIYFFDLPNSYFYSSVIIGLLYRFTYI